MSREERAVGKGLAMAVESGLGGFWLGREQPQIYLQELLQQVFFNLGIFTVTYSRDSLKVQGAVGQRILSFQAARQLFGCAPQCFFPTT